MYRYAFTLIAVALLTACSITQNIEPAHVSADSYVCIIENPKVRSGFIEEMKSVLNLKGIKYKVMPSSSSPFDCEWAVTYTANWSWDLSVYMSYAEIRVFHQGKLDGEAVYNSRGGGANLGKFIDAEPKVRELVDQLFQLNNASLFFRTFG